MGPYACTWTVILAQNVANFVVGLFWTKSLKIQKPLVPSESASKFGHISGLSVPKMLVFLVLMHSFILAYMKKRNHKLTSNLFIYMLISLFILFIEFNIMVPDFHKNLNKRMH